MNIYSTANARKKQESCLTPLISHQLKFLQYKRYLQFYLRCDVFFCILFQDNSDLFIIRKFKQYLILKQLYRPCWVFTEQAQMTCQAFESLNEVCLCYVWK
ncbi:Hypothetical_protein [Hexamita inflata]|uniref:Hypothetical_protein n=1 Tax=Hexamita inflata TaxID=28002 RepID=A0AA86NKD6_9EUKA|nr:Hypothetical protein HINF_LOCUS9055 [Hexamita inflata]